jgi:subtilisin family serine protease
MEKKPHLFLNNPRGQNKRFNATRKIDPQEIPDKAAEAYRPQKDKLAHSLRSFMNGLFMRRQERTIDVPAHLEFIEVHFFMIFSNNDNFQTKTRFKAFGLCPVLYRNFNQSVVFAITDHEKFQDFVDILQNYINSQDSVSPKNRSYSIATIIYDFEFLTTDKIGINYSNDLILSLVTRSADIKKDYDSILAGLFDHLDALKTGGEVDNYYSDEHSTIEIKNISPANVSILLKNFDIIFKIQSLRIPTIKEDEFNIPHLTWNVTIQPPENNIVIGILDNGVRVIRPLENIIVESNLDLTNRAYPNPTVANHPHGTVVASLAAVGVDLFDNDRNDFIADAYIMPIKVLDFNDGCFNIYDIESAIKKAYREGVKIFNLSVCGPTINYNSVVSEYAYLLDKLTYNLDILIFIAAGNLDESDIIAMNEADNLTDLHRYPNHFYNPNQVSDYHACEATNICIPAESYNNITVGAIAENFRVGTLPDLTPLKELPAYYTRKHYINPLAKINGTNFQDSQKNKNLNKPDIVMPGGDRLDSNSGMQVFGFGLNGNDFYNLDSGTSFSAPLAANLAAKIMGKYADLTMQSIKALILNSANPLVDSSFLVDIEKKIKEDESQATFGIPFDDLDKKQKKAIHPKFSADTMYKNLVGFGTPQIEKALFSDDKSVTVIVQDIIPAKTYKVININIPEYLLKYSKSSAILYLDATLCYKFFPVWGNQLAYNPLHISFNFVNSKEDNNPGKTAEILSDSKHSYFDEFYEEGMTDKDKLKARRKALGIKADLKPWSEDFFPPANKPFSNVQQLSLQINKDEIHKTNNQISLAIRCTHKIDLEQELLDHLVQGAHEFSIALNISEKSNSELGAYKLYDELVACNSMDSIGQAAIDNDLNADLDA